jgi:Mg2+/Co2+ transporter CorB
MASLSVTLAGVGAVTLLVLLSAFFSSSESAIFTLSDERLAASERHGDGRFETLRHLREDPHRLLVTILVGNNVVNVAIASITTVLLSEYLPTGTAVTAATVLASFVVLVFGEIVPKSYGIGHPESWALRVAKPIVVVERVLSPLVVVFDFITRKLNSLVGGDRHIEKPYVEE